MAGALRLGLRPVSTGEIVGIAIAVIVAFVAAGWQIKASIDRPRPRFTIEGEPPGEDGRLPVVLNNAGGAAVSCHALAHVGKDFYEFRGPIAAQLQAQTGSMARLGDESAPTESEAPFVVWVVAADGRDRWWDARRGRRIRRSVNKWLGKRSKAAGLAIPVEIPRA